jgi:autotransporter-associated beta strand protein
LAAGTLLIAHPSALGSGTLTLAGGYLDNESGAALTIPGALAQHWTGDFGFLGSADLNLGTGRVQLADNVALEVSAATLEVGGAISGEATLSKTGPGSLILSGSSDFSSLNLNAGTLRLKGGNAAGAGRVETGSGTTVALDAMPANPAGLLHRWSFNEIAGTVIADSVGSAHGAVVTPSGSSNASFGAGGLRLLGGARNTASYVNMPANLLDGLADFTLEVWASLDAVQSWSRILEFGDGASPETSFLTAFATGTDITNPIICDTAKSGNVPPVSPVQTTLGRTYHFAVVWDSSTSTVRWYRDGVFLAQFSETGRTLAQIPDNVFWLGRSHYSGDVTSAATYSELRMWSKPLDAVAIAASAAAGPDAVLGHKDYVLANALGGSAVLLKNDSNTVDHQRWIAARHRL